MSTGSCGCEGREHLCGAAGQGRRDMEVPELSGVHRYTQMSAAGFDEAVAISSWYHGNVTVNNCS